MSGTQNYSFQVGRDISVVLVAPNGTQCDLTGVTDVKWTARYAKVMHEPINTPTQERHLPTGHDFVLTLDRRSNANDVLFNQIEAGYWAGGYPNGTQNGGQIFVYTTEMDGSTTTEMGTNVSLSMPDRGNAKQTSAIQQTIEGFASTKVTL